MFTAGVEYMYMCLIVFGTVVNQNIYCSVDRKVTQLKNNNFLVEHLKNSELERFNSG